MSVNEESFNETPSAEDLRKQIAAIEQSAAIYVPPKLQLLPVKGDIGPRSGQIWATWPCPVFPDNLPENCQTEDPFLVLILDADQETVEGHHAVAVAPILDEADMAGPADLILPRSMLGYESAIAMDSSVGMLADNLAECVGSVPNEWMKKISTFSLYVNGLIQTIPEGIQTGREYLDEKDVRYVFHEELIDHLEYLQAPYLAWLESCGVFAEEVEVERESAFTRINAFMEGFDQAIREAFGGLLGQLAPLPSQAAGRGEQWTPALAFEGDLLDWVEKLRTEGFKGEYGDVKKVAARLQPGIPIKEHPGKPGKALARWEITQPPENGHGGEPFYVFDLEEKRMIGCGSLSPNLRLAILTEGDWCDFMEASLSPQRMVLLIETSSE